MRVHSDEEIIQKASLKEKNSQEVKDNKLDIVVDLNDDTGTCHTYVVTFENSSGSWNPLEVNELSSL